MPNDQMPPRAGQPSDSFPVLSTLSSDPDMGELIGLFVQDLPRRVEELQGVLRGGDWDAVRRVAHQLKGASAGYGFASLGLCAGELEARTIKASSSRAGTDLQSVREQVEALIALCSRVRANSTSM